MQQTLQQIVKEALEVKREEFERIVEEAKGLICGERGKTGNFETVGRLAKLAPVGEALFIGDLHGDLESLVEILNGSGFLEKMRQNSASTIIFLGDYGDRGAYSAEVYYTILRLKLLFPWQIILMRGNHEGPEDLLASPHDLPFHFRRRFGEKWQTAYAKIRGLFSCLYNAVLIEERYLTVHGGLPPQTKTMEDLAFAHEKHPKESLLEDILWSDPNDMIEGACGSPRGAGKLFGEKISREVLGRLNVEILIRGHEPCPEGFKINHGGRVLTLFSRKGAPYYNDYGAYLILDLSRKFQNAEQLTPYIRKF
ncbi:MAG: metallophosphoesterase family protein [Nitrososphaerota archaeon]|nr:serine/threonine protein phosphatase [Candidatus Bathyarchaeota archaeon]MDW8024066.1 metallophosphoesterase family protein [Nitrososphaerota archaeon]